MELRQVKQIRNLSGKRVLLRLDLNVPLNNGQVDKAGDRRLIRSLPTLNYLIKQKARTIIVAHLGRPSSRVDSDLSLLPVAEYLSKLLKQPIEFWSDDFRSYMADSQQLAKGSVVMLENIRFEPGEKKNSRSLAHSLSELADIYVDDAFGNIHRSDASMNAICDFLPAYAGFLVADEVKHLSSAIAQQEDLALIFGGAKVETKIKLLKKMSRRSERIVVGGPLASTLLKAAGYRVGKSLVDNKYIKLAKTLIKGQVSMPLDVNIATGLKARQYKTVTVDNVGKQMMILDIGPATVKEYLSIIKGATTIIWNGPLGYFENKNFVQGSKQIMLALAKTKARVILGGGETVELAEELKLDQKFDFISTGGGAMLSFLAGNSMPSLERLKVK